MPSFLAIARLDQHHHERVHDAVVDDLERRCRADRAQVMDRLGQHVEHRLAFAKAAASPPTRKVTLPAAIDCTPPPIAASTKATPAAEHAAASSRATLGVIVLVSMTKAGLLPPASSSATTAFEISGFGSDSRTVPALAPTSATDPAHRRSSFSTVARRPASTS
jgi:hypothetical protein